MSLGLHSLNLFFIINLSIYPLLDLFVKLHIANALFNISTFSHNLLLCCIRARVQSMSDIVLALPTFLLVLLHILWWLELIFRDVTLKSLLGSGSRWRNWISFDMVFMGRIIAWVLFNDLVRKSMMGEVSDVLFESWSVGIHVVRWILHHNAWNWLVHD